MENHASYLATSIWYKESIIDPYQVIAEYFKFDTVVSHRKTIKKVLKACSTDKLYRKSNPGQILYEFKMLESVINSAYIIIQDKKENPLVLNPADTLNKNLYCGRQQFLTEWDYFPRSLSMKEYINPYRAFERFFNYLSLEKWKLILQQILEYAISNTSFLENGETLDILSIYFHLTKLVEAAHLIDVREITHIGGPNQE